MELLLHIERICHHYFGFILVLFFSYLGGPLYDTPLFRLIFMNFIIQ